MNERASAIVDSFASTIKSHSRILDIGAGKGFLAQEMTRRFDARVTLVDVASYNQTDLPLTVCDSRALAFADNSFDYAVLSFVLHHSKNPNAILREALRVARKVIVIENDVHGKLRGIITQVIDSWPSIRHGTPPCYIAQTKDDWIKLFSALPIETRVVTEFSLEYGFFKNFTVVLTKDGGCITEKKFHPPSSVIGRSS